MMWIYSTVQTLQLNKQSVFNYLLWRTNDWLLGHAWTLFRHVLWRRVMWQDLEGNIRNMKIHVIWDAAPCRLVDSHRCFEGSYCLHLHDQTFLLWRNIPDDFILRHRCENLKCVKAVFLKLWIKEIRILKYREEVQVSREIPQEFISIFKYKFHFVWYCDIEKHQSIHWHVQNAVIPCRSQEPYVLIKCSIIIIIIILVAVVIFIVILKTTVIAAIIVIFIIIIYTPWKLWIFKYFVGSF